MSIAAIIVNYHTASFLPPLLQELFESPHIERAVVVDNSGELSTSSVLEHFDRLEILPASDNKGFGAAVNQALRKTTDEDWVLVLNPDMRLTEGSMDCLLEGARQTQTPLVGPRFFWDDHRVFRLPPATGSSLWLELAKQCADRFPLDADLFSFYWTLRHDRFWEADAPFFEPFLSGACLLLENRWIRSLGEDLFDERFFLYFEDSDLCVRSLKGGVRPLCIPSASVIHYYNQSPSPGPGKAHHMEEAQQAFLRKFYGAVSVGVPGSRSPNSRTIDLGEFTTVPVFELDRGTVVEEAYFEVAVSPYFVPFAQAVFSGPHFQFPEDVWSRLSPGPYYSRVRDRLRGSLVVWEWKKA
jgi:GT2 family glycosyltransferase